MLRFAKGLLKFRPPVVPVNNRFFCTRETKEVFDLRRDPLHQIAQSHTNCLVLHPVLYPNKGPAGELYLAEEAVGLAKALDWSIVKGPYWKDTEETAQLEGEETQESEQEKTKPSKSRKGKEEGYVPKEGDYVQSGVFKGTYHKGGIIIDMSSDEETDDLYDEWKNEILRESFAKSSLLKVRQTNKVSFFGKGKVVELGEFIRENQIDAVFINTELSGLQVRTLETRWNKIINHQDPNESVEVEQQENEEAIETDESDYENEGQRKIKVFDRFTIILQIFALRAQSRIAKLQIELAFLAYQKGKLMREGTTFSGYNIFSGDLMSANEIKLEVVSSKQRGALGKVGGEGETQLEIERRVISDKEAKIRRELLNETSSRQWLKKKRKDNMNTVPTIALIGYTNSGKSALMNRLTKAGVESQNMLFQTLTTTSKKLKLKSGQLGVLLDTIGFITNLPHDLIESFKCTLEEVADADIVLHVRDISHPQTDDQKETVLDVLRELKFEESFYNQRMIEVWNKIDLLEEPIDYKELALSDTPIVPISALYGTNCDKLIDVVTTRINEIMGKKKIVMVHSPEHHKERLNWLFKNGNIANVENFDFDSRPSKEFPYGKITFEIYLDDVTMRRYEATFGSKEGRKERDKLPEDWVKNSKSFFERRKEEQDRKKQLEEQQKQQAGKGEPKKLK